MRIRKHYFAPQEPGMKPKRHIAAIAAVVLALLLYLIFLIRFAPGLFRA